MKRTALAFGFVLLLFPASPPPRAGEEGPGLSAVLQRLEKEGKRLEDLKASFRQKKTYTIFDETETASGRLYYKKPKKMLWVYDPPASSRIYIAGEEARMVLPDINQVQRFHLRDYGKAGSLLIGFGQSREDLEGLFDIRLKGTQEVEGKRTHVLELTPKNEKLKGLFTRLDLWIGEDPWLPVKSVHHEPTGDLTELEFEKIELNTGIGDDVFKFAPPEGMEVVDYCDAVVP